MTAYLTVGDTVRWCDDLQSRGTVIRISEQPRRDMTGVPHDEWSRMVLVQWHLHCAQWPPTLRRWEAPELLVKVE
jgi:hypothetical protein